MAALGAIPSDAPRGTTRCFGELALDGSITPVRGRAARRHLGDLARPGADLPQGLRAGGGLGLGGDRGARAGEPHPDRQNITSRGTQVLARPVAAVRPRAAGDLPDPEGDQGAGRGAKGARAGARRRPVDTISPDVWPAGRRQVDAAPAPAPRSCRRSRRGSCSRSRMVHRSPGLIQEGKLSDRRGRSARRPPTPQRRRRWWAAA